MGFTKGVDPIYVRPCESGVKTMWSKRNSFSIYDDLCSDLHPPDIQPERSLITAPQIPRH